MRDDHILLLLHRDPETARTYWILPGGSMDEITYPQLQAIRRLLDYE